MQAARWSDLPGWRDDDLKAALPPLLQSCRALASRPQWPLWRAACDEAKTLSGASTARLRSFFETQFLPFLLTQPDASTQGLVTGQMAETVVVCLEIVDIDHQQRQLLPLTHGPTPLEFKVLVEVPTIGQPGEAVGIHQPLQHQVGVQQLLLAHAQRAVGLVALQQGQVGA